MVVVRREKTGELMLVFCETPSIPPNCDYSFLGFVVVGDNTSGIGGRDT